MGYLFAYTLIAGIVLLPLYLIYKLLLGKETFHRFNRIVVLLSYLLSLTAPLLYLGDEKTSDTPALPTTIRLTPDASTFVMESDQTAVLHQQVLHYILLAAILIYVAGLLFFVGREIYTWWRMGRMIATGNHSHTTEGWTLVLHHQNHIAPFSWGRYIVMSQQDYDSQGATILIHEQKHLQCRHWVDLLLAEGVAVLLWYNPAGWLMRNELQNIHEYEADEAVLKEGVDARTYQLLLIKKAVGSRFPSIANSLNHSKLKKRITMMLREKSNPTSRWRIFATLPALALVALLLTTPVIAGGLQKITATKVTNNQTNEQSKTLQIKTVGTVDNVDVSALKVDDSTSIYIDGKKVSYSELKNLPAGATANVNIDRQEDGTVISITTKDGTKSSSAIVVTDEEVILDTLINENIIVVTNKEKTDGEKEPVFVVNGKVVENINDINTNDIESINVYKDASEIVKRYKAEGRGLIVVTLKKK